ncbi:MAG: ExbD/TolR family protein [Planctomycetota bacterium]
MASSVVAEQQDVKAEMSFAPMIDVVFQLLIFFLVCSRVKQTEDKMDVYLPTDEGLNNTPWQKIDKPEPIYVLVKDDEGMRNAPSPLVKYSRDATYYINSADGVAYKDLNQLREELKTLIHNPETELIIYPLDEQTRKDQETPWKNVLGVVDAGYYAGFKKIKFRPPRQFW